MRSCNRSTPGWLAVARYKSDIPSCIFQPQPVTTSARGRADCTTNTKTVPATPSASQPPLADLSALIISPGCVISKSWKRHLPGALCCAAEPAVKVNWRYIYILTEIIGNLEDILIFYSYLCHHQNYNWQQTAQYHRHHSTDCQSMHNKILKYFCNLKVSTDWGARNWRADERRLNFMIAIVDSLKEQCRMENYNQLLTSAHKVWSVGIFKIFCPRSKYVSLLLARWLNTASKRKL